MLVAETRIRTEIAHLLLFFLIDLIVQLRDQIVQADRLEMVAILDRDLQEEILNTITIHTL